MQKYHSYYRQRGFTLIELMIVTVIIVVIAAIAIPSYQTYIIRNAEQSAQAEIKQLENQLERWRSSRLTYLGFTPELGKDVCSGDVKFCYVDPDNTVVYVPLGSDAHNFKYMITIVDANDNKSSLVPSDTDTSVNVSVGRSWKIFATPRSEGSLAKARRIMLTSNGVQCMTNDTKITVDSDNCGTHYTSSSW